MALLRSLRGPRGGPALRTRLLALALVAGMVVFTAPLIVLPLVHWLAHHL